MAVTKSDRFLPSPAYPAFIICYGLLFVFAVVNFSGLQWQKYYTVLLFFLPLTWVFAEVFHSRKLLLNITSLDGLFLAFILLILASLLFHEGTMEVWMYYAKYFPFLVIAPYLCGRLMYTQDINTFARICLYLGIALLPILLLDKFTSTGREYGRWPFFGQDHGALLAGSLLTAALLAAYSNAVGFRSKSNNRIPGLIYAVSIILVSAFLAWTGARGWIIASVFGLATIALCNWRNKELRIALIGYFILAVTIVVMTFAWLPSSAGENLAMIWTTEISPGSCQSVIENNNSIAIRWVLYQEAVAIWKQFPIFGVGAANFGDLSCTGPLGYPHSTVLQAFSEVGLIGGGVLLTLLTLSSLALVRRFFTETNRHGSAGRFLIGLFAAFLLVDQVNGNYFMATGTFFVVGIASRVSADERQKNCA